MLINPELLKMARGAFEKSAVVPSDAAMANQAPDPSMLGVQGAAGPVDPATAAMGAAPGNAMAPVDPSQDPTGAAMAAAPPAPAPAAPAAPPAAAGAPAGQKLKPEQMMQMLDYRLYNMQQQLTAIMNAMGVQVPPESLVLPPGTTGAPPAETALPGGPMAPPAPQQDPNAPAGPQDPGMPQPPGGPMDPSMAAMDPNAPKQAWWVEAQRQVFADPNKPTETQLKAAALQALIRSMERAR